MRILFDLFLQFFRNRESIGELIYFISCDVDFIFYILCVLSSGFIFNEFYEIHILSILTRE